MYFVLKNVLIEMNFSSSEEQLNQIETLTVDN